MNKFLINLFRLIRPLSNVKNIALIILSFYLSKADFNLILFLAGFLSLSFVCSSFYAYNTLYDYNLDKNDKNKNHYSEAIDYLGRKTSFVIFISLLTCGFIIGFFVNFNFLSVLALLALTNFFYSSKKFRFKERVILDVLFGATFTFFFRFVASWFIFSVSIPPLLVAIALVSAKSAGYLLYKEVDRPFFEASKVKNSITAVKKETIIIISAIFWLICFLSFFLLCFGSKYFPIKFLFLLPLAIPPLIIVYLSALNKIKTKIKYLRIIGFIYWLLILIIIFKLLW